MRTQTALLLLSLTAFSCEEVVTDEPLPYVERLVVSGVVEAHAVFTTVIVTRTLPPGEAFDFSRYSVSGAVVRISTNGSMYVLGEVRSGEYRTSLPASEGETFALTVQWKGLTAVASTRIPTAPVVDTAIITVNPAESPAVQLTGIVTPVAGVAYGETFEIRRPGRIDPRGAFGSLLRAQDQREDGRIHLVERYSGLDAGPNDRVFAVIHAYDEPFYRYFVSRGAGEVGDNGVLAQFGGSTSWNVTGDGIGIFVGKSTATKQAVIIR